MSFDISFDDRPATSHFLASGCIELGGERESFESLITYWSRDDYESHWHRAATRLIEGSPASFVVSIDGPTETVGERWVAWPDRKVQIVFRNWLILPELPPESAFDPEQPETAPNDPPRNVGGPEPSTWVVPYMDVVSWARAR
jgi:hypothetical protein